MPFHVEISSGLHRARGFNLSHEELLANVVSPWLEERTIELGEREWEPSDRALKILEGPELGNPDLSFGQAWANAERTAENVTRRVLEEAPRPSLPDAFVVEADLPEALVAEMPAEWEARAMPWREAQARIDGRDPQIAAVILVVKRPEQQPGSPRS